MKTAIVTGATGFIGRWLVRYLISQNVIVYIVLRNRNKLDSTFLEDPNIIIVETDLLEIGNHRTKFDQNIDVFYHLAWEGASGQGRSDFLLQLKNVEMSLQLIEFAQEISVKKFVSIGTIAEKFVETSRTENNKNGNLIYALSKSYFHRVSCTMVTEYKMKFIWCVLPGVYGEGDNTTNIINYTIDNLANKKIPEFGSGNQIFDFIHVKDCVRALYLIGKFNNKHDEYFLGSGNPKQLKEFLKLISLCFDNDINLSFGIREDDGVRYDVSWFSTRNIIEDYGFISEIDFVSGIEDLITYRSQV